MHACNRMRKIRTIAEKEGSSTFLWISGNFLEIY